MDNKMKSIIENILSKNEGMLLTFGFNTYREYCLTEIFEAFNA